MDQHRDLNVRQHARAQIELPAELRVTPEHQAQVRFTGECDATSGPHTLMFRLVDLGAGGAGGHSSVFIPRMMRAQLRIYEAGEPNQDREPIFEHEVRVRRCELIGPEPTYLLGIAFEGTNPDLPEQISRTLERATMQAGLIAPADSNDAEGEICA